MNVIGTPLQGLVTVDTDARDDARGRFERLFCAEAWQKIRPGLSFAQVNLSTTYARGTIRGMHYQRAPMAEAKLIRCVQGRVFDVAVDLRPTSPTFLRWHGVELSSEQPREVFIPEGFAHGFQALSDDACLLYFHTQPWAPECEGGVRHDDPRLAIAWPLPVARISDRDAQHPMIDSNFEGVAA